MEQHGDGKNETAQNASRGNEENRSEKTREDALEAEEESAEAMDADVPQPPDASKTTEGQPS